MNIRRAIGALVLGVSLTLTACDDITGSGGDATIIVENNASVSVFYFYISDCSDSSWGNDELGAETISPGEEESFGVDEGCYDLRAEFADDSYAEEFGVNLDEGDEFTWELVD